MTTIRRCRAKPAWCDRRHRASPARADRHRLVDGELLPASLGHGLLGAGLCRLGLPEPHHGLARLGTGPVRIPLGRLHGEPLPDGIDDAAAADDGIDNQLDPGEPEERNIYEAMEAGKQVKKLPMSLGEALEALARTTRSSSAAMPGEMYRLSTRLQGTSGSASCTPSPIGTRTPTWTACRNRTTGRLRPPCPSLLKCTHQTRSDQAHVWNCRTHSPRRRRKDRAEMTSMLQALKHRGARLDRLRHLRRAGARRIRPALQGRRTGRPGHRASRSISRSRTGAPSMTSA